MRANARFALVFALLAVSFLGNQPAEAATGAEVARQRLESVAIYQTCVEDAAGNKLEIEACESFLKASESLK